MNWKKLGATVLSAVFVCTAAFAGLEAYVPDDVPFVAQLNANTMFKAIDANLAKFPQDVQEEYQEFRKQCEALKLDHAQLCNRLLFTGKDEKSLLILLDTNVTEEKLALVLTALSEDGTDVRLPPPEEKDGRKFYVIKDQEAELQEDTMAFTYLTPNVVAIIFWNDSSRALLKAPCGKCPLMDKLADKKLLSGALVVPEEVRAQMAQEANGKKMDPAPKSGDCWVDLTGKDKADLEADVNLEGVTKEGRDQLAAMLGMYLPMAGMAFSEDPELGMAVVKAIKVIPQGELNLRITAYFPEELLNKINAYWLAQEKAAEEAEAAAEKADEKAEPEKK